MATEHRLDILGYECPVSVTWVERPGACRIEHAFKPRTVHVWAVQHSADELPGGQRMLDGCVTLAVAPIPSRVGRAWRAAWAYLNRQYGVYQVRQGVILVDGEDVYHASNLASAFRMRGDETAAVRRMGRRMGVHL